MTNSDKAVKTFNEGFNCAQAVLSVFGEQQGLERSVAMKLASGFGGGIGCTGGICGALSGAIMALGLTCGPAEADKMAKAEMYRKTRLLSEEFKARTGSIFCRDLLGFDLGTPDGIKKAALPGSLDKCDDFVRIAAKILQETIGQ